jgi:hypothetical protein
MFGESRMSSADCDWAQDAIGSYILAIKLLRESYLANRLPGESANENLDRMSKEPQNMPIFYPYYETRA